MTYTNIADRFVQWFREGYCTPFGYSFDIGYGTRVAMSRLIRGGDPLKAGPADEHNNGNGSLMRILPAAIYFSHLPDLDLIDKIVRYLRLHMDIPEVS